MTAQDIIEKKTKREELYKGAASCYNIPRYFSGLTVLKVIFHVVSLVGGCLSSTR